MSRSAPVKLDVISSISNFGDLLRYLRQRAQITQRDLALATGYSTGQISRLEHNQRLPDELTLLAVFVPALELEQEPATVERLLALARQARGDAAADPAPLEISRESVRTDHAVPRPTPRLTNLPHRLTSFIGRDGEVIALQRLVKSHRLVTLTGVGGVGKSSLSLAVAATLPFPDGVWLLELAPIAEGGLVARALMNLFQLPESPERTPLEAVIAYLQPKTLLLIVDNCEHLIATCAELVDRLLRASAKLHIVATSREMLNIAGEREWPVAPLPTPPHAPTDGTVWSLPQLQPFAAAQLFMERAQEAKAALVFADQDAPLIAQLCQQVDGIPLALELAAARCKSFALPEIVARLHDRFALLSAGRRTALLRHQTLRATIDWSYDLLSPAEAALLRSLSVFAGGWTLAAAEAVADPGQGNQPTFDLLHQLVNKSLIIIDQRGETTRYRMLETIREYAGEKLEEHGETAIVHIRHFAYYLALAEKSLPANMLGARLDQWFNEVRADLDNVRAAFAWSQTQADRGEKSLRLAVALGPFWLMHKSITEGTLWLESALAHAKPDHEELTGWGVVWLGFVLIFVTPRSFDLAIEALQRFKRLNHPDGMAIANLLLGIWAVARGEATKAIGCLQHAVAQFETKQAVYLLGRAYFYLADAFVLAGMLEDALHYYRRTYQLGEDAEGYTAFSWVWDTIAVIDPAQAIALCQKQLARQQQRPNQAKVAGLYQRLGHILTVAGDLAGASAALAKSLALWQTLDIQWRRGGGTSRVCLDLALVQHLRQEHLEAMAYAQRALQLFQAAGDLQHVAYAYVALGYPALAAHDLPLALASFHQCVEMIAGQESNCAYLALVGLADVARCQGKRDHAARLFGATERFTQRPKPIEDRWKEAYCEPLLTAAHAQLRDGAYAAAWADGQTMPLEQAVQLALTVAAATSSHAPLLTPGSEDLGLPTQERR